jgi:hypothetical protein
MTELKVGDSVVVKPGIADPDLATDLSGWQGRIQEFIEGGTICINWDSVTLQNIPKSFLEQCEQEGYEWQVYHLQIEDVEPAQPRDNERDIAKAVDKIRRQVAWLDLGEEGKRIHKILTGIDLEDTSNAFAAWEEHLSEHLTFPFNAKVDDGDGGPLQTGDQVSVLGIAFTDDEYGIIVEVKHRSGKAEFPLCDLTAIGKNQQLNQLVKDYAVWFANRYE